MEKTQTALNKIQILQIQSAIQGAGGVKLEMVLKRLEKSNPDLAKRIENWTPAMLSEFSPDW